MSLFRERELRQRIRDLGRFRKNGITRTKESADFERERLKRIRRRNEMRRRQQQQQGQQGQGGGQDSLLTPGAAEAAAGQDLKNAYIFKGKNAGKPWVRKIQI